VRVVVSSTIGIELMQVEMVVVILVRLKVNVLD
jgi:hypothetical protein